MVDIDLSGILNTWYFLYFSKSDRTVAKNIPEQMKIKDRCFYLRINSILIKF